MEVWVPLSRKLESKPILLVGGASVDSQMFALPTIPFNFVDYLLEKGYTIYCVVHRVGRTPIAKGNWTTYDARLDIAAATKYILTAEHIEKIYAVVHCAGSTAMAMGLLDGSIQGIGGLTASQVFMEPVFAEVNMLKAKIKPSMATVYNKVIGPWYDCVSGKEDTIFQECLNQALRAYPEGAKTEICKSVVCHRSELVFGRYARLRMADFRLWTHDNFNEATHLNLGNFLGGVSMNCLNHLMFMGREGYVVDNTLHSLLTPKNIQRLENIPILFIHGSNNAVFNPESTMKDYDLLRERFGSGSYERVEYAGKGHLDCWMGKASFEDVYPRVEQHARKTAIQAFRA
jgi:hypothetical protein